MANIQSLGIGSGVLTSELVDDIIAAEREATDLRIDAKQAEFDAKISAFGALQSALDGLQTRTSSLSSSLTLLSNSATSTNESAVSATATTAAQPGVHSVEVQSLARAHTVASIRFDDITSIVGDGQLDFRFGTTTFDGTGQYDTFTENPDRAAASVTIDADNNTLAGVRDAINESNVGVTASIVNDGQGYLLVLTSERTGLDHSMEITVTEGETAGLSALALNAGASTPGVNMTQTVAADDANMVVDGIAVTRETNSFSEVIAGVTFNAVGLNVGSPATVTIARDVGDAGTRMREFVDAFNTLKALADDLTDFDEEKGTGALLTGDSTLRGIQTQLRRFLTGSVTSPLGSDLRSLVDLGIATDQNLDYQLTFDAGRFDAALAEDPEGVVALLADHASASDSLIRFSSFQNATRAGSYDIEVTQLATQGFVSGATTAALDDPIVIDADNDTFSISVDGVNSSVVQLAQGSYATAAALAQAMQTQINDDPTLEAAGVGATVTYNSTDQRFEFRSNRFGGNSQIGLFGLDTSSGADLGLVQDSGESGRGSDVAGTINGVDAVGAGQFLTVPVGSVPATAGFFRGQAISGFDSPPLTIDGTNNNFVISVDGSQSGAIVLAEGDYATGAELAAEIESTINADSALSATGASVSVGWDSINGRFTITSASTGSGSRVAFVAVAAGVSAALGFSVAAGTPGRNAATISDAAAGVQIQVLGGTTGYRGTATLVRGAMNRMNQFLTSALNAGGTVDNKLNSLQAQLDDLARERSEFDVRMDRLEERLRSQFAVADALISQLNSTADFLDLQLASLPLLNRKDN